MEKRMRKKRVLSLVLALSLVLGAVPAFGTIGVGATEGTAPWEKKEPSIATQWYDRTRSLSGRSG